MVAGGLLGGDAGRSHGAGWVSMAGWKTSGGGPGPAASTIPPGRRSKLWRGGPPPAALFALPAASILLAQGLSAAARRRATAAGVMVLGGVLTVAAMAGLTVRFGNEHFERVTDDDLAAVSWVYENVPPGTVLVAPTRNLPWRYRDLTSYRYEPLDEQPLDSTDKVLALIPDDGNAYLISTPAQQQFGEQLAFLPSGRSTSITAELVDAGVATEVFRQGDAAVYRLDAGPKP